MTDSRGFTLIEMLIASALIAVVLLATAVMTTASYSTVDRSGEHTATVALSQQRIEWLRNQAYTSGSLAAGTVTETLTGTYLAYSRTTTIVNDVPRARVKQITVQTTAPSGLQAGAVTYIAQ